MSIDLTKSEPVDVSELNVDDVVRLSYKKEKQAYYAVRFGVVQEVKRNAKNEVESILLFDHTAGNEEYLDDPEPRRFLASRIGTIDRYAEVAAQPKHSPVEQEEVVTFTIPKGKKAYLRIENRQ